jgi:hypothetical protein
MPASYATHAMKTVHSPCPIIGPKKLVIHALLCNSVSAAKRQGGSLAMAQRQHEPTCSYLCTHGCPYLIGEDVPVVVEK